MTGVPRRGTARAGTICEVLPEYVYFFRSYRTYREDVEQFWCLPVNRGCLFLLLVFLLADRWANLGGGQRGPRPITGLQAGAARLARTRGMLVWLQVLAIAIVTSTRRLSEAGNISTLWRHQLAWAPDAHLIVWSSDHLLALEGDYRADLISISPPPAVATHWLYTLTGEPFSVELPQHPCLCRHASIF